MTQRLTPRRIRVCLCVGLLLALCSPFLFTHSAPRRRGTPTAATPSPTPATPSPTASPTPSLSDEKTRVEIQKLNEELKGLQLSNSARDVSIKWLTVWITALGTVVGGLFGFIITAVGGLVGFYFSVTQNRKLRQDKRLAREEQLLKVFHDLGDKEPRIRVGAVAVLVQRLNDLREKKEEIKKQSGGRWISRRRGWVSRRLRGETFDHEELKEFPTIVSVLISVSKNESEIFVQKYIADGLADGLGAIVDPEQDKRDNVTPPKKEEESPLKKFEFQGTKFLFDFQGARLQNAWWYSINARGVDFYDANLSRAGLREAFLEGAVLKNANLTGATLARAYLNEAQLQNARLDRANLRGADLSKADLSGANLQSAKLSKSKSESKKSGDKATNLTDANLKGADLTNADLSDANLSGANLSGANLSGAKLAGANVKGAKFDRADVTGVDFSGVLNLNDGDLSGAVGYVPPT